MTGVDRVIKYRELLEKAKTYFDENTAKKVASVVAFNDDRGIFKIGNKFYEVGDGSISEADTEEPSIYYLDDGDGFLIIEDGVPVGFTMPPETVIVSDFSLSNYEISLRFEYEFIDNKPVLRFVDKRPHLVGKLVFYNELTGWKVGRVEDITTIENEEYIVLGVPVIGGEPKIVPFIPVSLFGYPNDEYKLLSLIKADLVYLKREYSTKENLKALAETQCYTLAVMERLMSYRDELLLWEIAEDVVERGETLSVRTITH